MPIDAEDFLVSWNRAVHARNTEGLAALLADEVRRTRQTLFDRVNLYRTSSRIIIRTCVSETFMFLSLVDER